MENGKWKMENVGFLLPLAIFLLARQRPEPSPGGKVDSNSPNTLGEFEDGRGTAIS